MSDPGLAAERTVLGWQRTAFGLLGVAALVLRFAARESVLALGAVVAAGGLLAALVAWWHGSHARRIDGREPGAAGPPRLLSLAVAAVAAGAAVTVVAGLGRPTP
jgi:uncharacterized membrane protein YidH (DUF202 family)